jgi:hypothetical protein
VWTSQGRTQQRYCGAVVDLTPHLATCHKQGGDYVQQVVERALKSFALLRLDAKASSQLLLPVQADFKCLAIERRFWHSGRI